MMSRYLEPSTEAGRAFSTRKIDGPVVMLNLLRFRDTADYSASPELARETPIGGAEDYRRYVAMLVKQSSLASFLGFACTRSI
jgi:hypothetical protein